MHMLMVFLNYRRDHVIQSKNFCLLKFSLKNFKIKYVKQWYIHNIWLWNVVSYINWGTQAKNIWKHDPEANNWAQEGWGWGVQKASQWGSS